MKIRSISIITVSFNAAHTIEQTIKSVASQSYKNIEYIVVDGGSTDGTIDIIKKYAQKKIISKWISEKDRGLYDAMNKGVRAAKGDVVYFLNADDHLKSVNAVSSAMKPFTPDTDGVYGDIEFYYPAEKKTVRVSRTASVAELKKGNMPPHQGTFVRRELLLANPFDITYKSSADFDFFCRVIQKGAIFVKIPTIIATMQMGGVSAGAVSYRETEKAVRKYFGEAAYLKIKAKHALFGSARFVLSKTGLLSVWHSVNNKVGL